MNEIGSRLEYQPGDSMQSAVLYTALGQPAPVPTIRSAEKMTKTKQEYLAIIDEIQEIRSKNNKNWMDLLRLAFELDPPAAAAIVAKIYEHDGEISDLAKKLTE